MNIKLLRRVADAIKKEPLAFNMDTYTRLTSESPCGATGCIAGMACFLSDPVLFFMDAIGIKQVDIKGEALRFLGLNEQQGERLFYLDASQSSSEDMWPTRFCASYDRARSAKAKAKVAADRIEHFIKTKGRE